MSLEILIPAEHPELFTRPFYAHLASCGFPSPADDYVEKDLDLNEYHHAGGV